MRITTDGKFFCRGDERFPVRGVTYGTFEPRSSDGARVPPRDRIKQDFESMTDAGFNVVRTYTAPPDDLLDLASDAGLAVLAGCFFPDWRYLVGGSRRDRARITREARAGVREQARRLEGNEHVLALCLGNEIPADVIRWCGTRRIADAVSSLVDVVRSEDDGALVTYANYPTAEYLPLDDVDFLTFNVYLERRVDLRRYLTRLHHLAGDRPVVLGEVGLDGGLTADSEQWQADTLDWQLETALERGVAGTCVFAWTDEWTVGEHAIEDWHFGLTRADRTPKPALDVVAGWNARSVRDLRDDWPRLSVVVCAYNAEATLDECLRHTAALDYPDLEIIVVDDGSTDRTAEIAAAHPEVRLLSVPHGGLSVARNAGYASATGSVVAYLDSDAYPTPEWPYYLVIGFDGPMVAGAGGPNVPPRDDPASAHQVALSPGGPVHVLLTDDRAEHVPGCNMAFVKRVLEEVGGCDPIYTAAGDDVDLCWKVLDRGYEIGFHPSALVWHHRRPGLRPYLRQQRGYGRSEALVSARHPDRYTGIGSARWKGRIYTLATPPPLRSRVYHGIYGTASYQSVYRSGGHALDIAHQVGIPVATLALATLPLVTLNPVAALPAALAVGLIVALFVIDAVRATPPRHLRGEGARFRAGVAVMHLLQPLVRTWGRVRSTSLARRDLPPASTLQGPVTRPRRNVLLLPSDRPRADFVAAVIADLRRCGYRIITPSGWETYDAELIGSLFVSGELVTSAFPEGCVQATTRLRLRRSPVLLAIVLLAMAAWVLPVAGVVLLAALVVESARGVYRARGGALRAIEASAT